MIELLNSLMPCIVCVRAHVHVCEREKDVVGVARGCRGRAQGQGNVRV
jgi:hypothetical protein